jgi:squalene-hopene/tetraprenyl-beta-curcumene cyclase
MSNSQSPERIDRCYETVRGALLAERNAAGHWEGKLSASALSTATAVMALEMVRRDQGESRVESNANELKSSDFNQLIDDGLQWLAASQNKDGGWGDTVKSLSNISTTMLVHASFHAAGDAERHRETIDSAAEYIQRVGGIPALRARYGKDKTFSIPILTHCALAGLVDWKEVDALPFELACLPPQFYKTVRLPVVSYALPALIAIGQVRHHFRKPWNPLFRLIRRLSIGRTLKTLRRIQPTTGGFLEATPLTSFVTMSLAGMGKSDHAVAQHGVQFIVNSVNEDGSWPIDTNLATWVTTLAVNGLKDGLPESERSAVRDWLLGQQYRELHPYTNADPGGWAWTDLSGGVPDADDTPGAMLALMNLVNNNTQASGGRKPPDSSIDESLANAVQWLLGLQNGNGGWPTFCRGWGTLPFDRSAADITAHAIRALQAWVTLELRRDGESSLTRRAFAAIRHGFEYLNRVQRNDGSWLPLWFGNQFADNDENPTYGTARVLAAYRDAGLMDKEPGQRGLAWLEQNQNDDGGWGGSKGIPSSNEETALAAEILLSVDPNGLAAQGGLDWLLRRIEAGTYRETTPIGFYFAKLWYSEDLYPLTFMVGALRVARDGLAVTHADGTDQVAAVGGGASGRH